MVTIHIDFYISPYVILANHESYEWDDPPSTPRSFMKGAGRRNSEVSGRTAAMPASRRSGTGRRRGFGPAGTRWGGLYDLGVTDWGFNMGTTMENHHV
jgi:hypothetical protein